MSDKNIKCCENKCINTDKPIGNCIKGNGFINLIDGENIKYIKCSGKGEYIYNIFNLFVQFKSLGKDKVVGAVSENEFKKPKDTVNYSLCYFEIKSKIEGVKSDKNVLAFGLRKNNNRIIKLDIDDAYVLYKYHSKLKKYKLPTTFSLNNNDTFGIGLVYPPTNK
uniref:DOMON domain-containing protein n=1 Tax=Meloidogyne hapla TaxID=6305 RepID=A0A1I8C1H5_MELHA